MLGVHIHRNNLLDEILRDEVNNWAAIQIYTHGPQNYKKNKDIAELIKYKDKIQIYVHASHMSKPFKGNKMIIGHIKEQLKTAATFNAKGLIIHLPKDTPETVAKYFKVIEDKKVPILLEMPSAVPSELSYETPEKINRLIECIGAGNYGIVVDTSHLWATEQNIKTLRVMDNWFKRLKYPRRIKLIHLNGSKVPFGKHKDIHCIPTLKDDHIWGDIDIRKSGIISCIKFAKKYNIPIILEINRDDDKLPPVKRKLLSLM